MTQRTKIRNLAFGGFYIMLGIVLPMITHSLGAGNVILPMHIPVLLAGLTLPAGIAVVVGAACPLLSSLLTGMPVLLPMLPIMFFELSTYALVAALLSKKEFNVWICLIGAMIAGRIVAGLTAWVLSAVFSVTIAPPVTYVATAVVTGLPGIIAQILLIPVLYLLVTRLLRAGALNSERKYFDEKSADWDAVVQYDLSKIDRILDSVDVNKKRVIDAGSGTGVLLEKLLTRGATHITAVDISPSMLDVSKKNHGSERISYVVGDIMTLGTKDTADICIAYSVWPHIFDKSTFFKNVHKLLASEGLLVVAHSSPRELVNERQGKKNALVPADVFAKRAKKYGFDAQTCIDDDIYCVVLKKN